MVSSIAMWLTIQYQSFVCTVEWLNNSLWHIDGTLIGTTILGQNGPESNVNKRGTPHSLGMKSHHQMV